MSGRIMAVVRREFTTRVHTRTFVISTVLLPVMLLIYALVPMLLMSGANHTTRIAIVDATSGELAQRIEQVLGAEKLGQGQKAVPRYRFQIVPATDDVAAMRDKLIGETGFGHGSKQGRFDGVLILPKGVLDSGKPTYYGSDASAPKAMKHLQSDLSKVFAGTRLAQAGMDVGKVSEAMRPVDLTASKVSSGELTGQSGEMAFFVAYAMGFLLYLAIVIFAMRTMTSVIEEKTSRVVEVLVSSLTPFQMLLGKVLGVGSAGLLQMAIWGVSGWLITRYGTHLATLAGADPSTMAHFAMPHISAGLVGIFLVYFVLGFLIYGALYAGIGSICNTVADSQQYSILVRVLIIIGFISVFAVIPHPDGTVAHVMSWIPFFAPFVMPVRWALTSVSAVNLAGSLALMVLGLVVCVWLAARIYNTGILMFGKKPSWRELWRWIRAS